MRTYKIPPCSENRKYIPIMPSDLALWLTLFTSNYPCLEHIFMVPKVFELLKFDCSLYLPGKWLFNWLLLVMPLVVTIFCIVFSMGWLGWGLGLNCVCSWKFFCLGTSHYYQLGRWGNRVYWVTKIFTTAPVARNILFEPPPPPQDKCQKSLWPPLYPSNPYIYTILPILCPSELNRTYMKHKTHLFTFYRLIIHVD